ncbi:RagB/SusD family nutrient uptake outer membrane protein [Flavobacteriaceae bacterium R38]|nr:RagB/SusD family nutrient uptake outer membrane protein [Flavobacteriaceae bacterium R38]
MKKNIIFKKALHLLLAIPLFVATTGCENDLDNLPEDQLGTALVTTSEAAINALVVGMYRSAQEVAAFNGNRYVMDAVQSDEGVFVGSFTTIANLFEYIQNPTNGTLSAFWNEAYEMINLANFILENVPAAAAELPDITDDELTQILAQARFIRGIAYFQISQLYAQPFQVSGGSNLAVIIVPGFFGEGGLTEDELINLSRSTLNEVHQLVADDLDFAIANLTNTTDHTIANVDAARGMRARLHLYRGEWAQAAQLANQVISDANVTFSPDYTFFGTTGGESLYVLANDAQNGAFGGTGLANFANGSTTGAGRGDLFYSDELLAAHEAGDTRLTDPNFSILATDVNGTEERFQAKVGGSGAIPVIVMRLTEMYFIRAEANLQDGTTIGDTPVNDINLIRNRAGVAPLAAVTIDDILDERFREFAFEGHRRMDLLRNQRSLRQPGNPQFDDSGFGQPLTIYPINQRDIDLSPGLAGQQNPGY